jgi:hypothetical protein
MALIEERHTPEASHTSSLSIERRRGTVVVTVHCELTPDLVTQLRHVVHDLVEGQGNLHVKLELPELEGVNATLLSLLVDTASNLEGRYGSLRVTTPRGAWQRPAVAAVIDLRG